MAVNWTLKNSLGSPLAHQPSAGSPLALKFNTTSDAHVSGHATELIDVVECVTTSSPVVILLTPDSNGYTLDEPSSTPSKVPAEHGGTLMWTIGAGGVTTLSFTAPAETDAEWGWTFGLGEPTIALKLKVKVKKA